MTRLWVLAALAACGAPAGTAGTPAAPGAPAHTAPLSPADERRHICQRAGELARAKCSPFDEMDAQMLGDCSVADGIYIAGAQACIDEPSCEAVSDCISAAGQSDAPYAGPTAACGTPSDVPAGVSAADFAASYGRADVHFADSPSSAAQPIEVCGMPAETAYLTRVVCADGSHPFADRDAAASARTGNAGAGGRCGRIIDQYAVPCAETAYTVFIDAYRCPARSR